MVRGRLITLSAELTPFLPDYRRGWATYESLYLFAKLTALMVVATIDPDNCVFRSASRDEVKIARQSVLLAAMCCFFVLQCLVSPFLDPVSNASEWVSRLNYVLTSAIALCVALEIPGKEALSGVVLYMCVSTIYLRAGRLHNTAFMWPLMGWRCVCFVEVIRDITY